MRSIASVLVPVAAFLISGASAVQAAPPCWGGPQNAAFNPPGDFPKCRVANSEGIVQRGHNRLYNVYCPRRLSQADAERVASGLVAGTIVPEVGANPIPGDYQRRGHTARYVNVPHRFHYSCQDATRGVGEATHLKVAVATEAPADRDNIIRNCRHVTDSGSLESGRLDRQYQCGVHLLPAEYGNVTRQVAFALVSNDFREWAERTGGKLCILRSTNIQCAPCTSSDTLVVRLEVVSSPNRCVQEWGNPAAAGARYFSLTDRLPPVRR